MPTGFEAAQVAEFEEYVDQHWSRLVRSAVLLGCELHEAEDMVQTALTKCLMKWSRVRGADDRDAYVHRVLINTFTSARRRRWTGERPTAELPERRPADDLADDLAESVAATDALARSLARLNEDQRTAVVLRYYAQLSEQQMASVLGVRPGTVKSRLSRALRLLAEDPTLADLRGLA